MSTGVKFYLDEHINHALLHALRRHAHDVVTAAEAQGLGHADEAHLRHAAAQGRVMVTQDQDFLKLHASAIPHAGIVYFPQGTPLRAMVEAVLLVAGAMSPEELVNTVQYL